VALSVGKVCPLACQRWGQQRTCCAQREFCRVWPRADVARSAEQHTCQLSSLVRPVMCPSHELYRCITDPCAGRTKTPPNNLRRFMVF